MARHGAAHRRHDGVEAELAQRVQRHWGREGKLFWRKAFPPFPKTHPSLSKDFRLYRIPLVGFPCGYEKGLNTYLFRPLFLGGKRKGLQTVSGTDSFRVSSPSVEVFAGGVLVSVGGGRVFLWGHPPLWVFFGGGGGGCFFFLNNPPPPRFFTSFHPIISARSGPSRRDGVRASAGNVPARRHAVLERRVAVAAVLRRPWRFRRFGEGRGL